MLPVLVGVIPFALLLGAAGARKGLSPLEVALMCGLNFAGGSEFVALDLWHDPAPLALIAGMTLLVNCRHLLMGGALVPHLRRASPRQVWPALYFMADEVWALALADAQARGRDGRLSMPFYAGLAVALHLSWVAGTTSGVLIGNVIGDPAAYGFDMAFTAVFLVLLKGLWRGPRSLVPWLTSLAVASLVHVLVPGAWYVAAGALAGVGAAFLMPARA